MPDDALTIRPATLPDADALSLLAAATFPLGCPPDTAPAHLNSFISTELTPARFGEFVVTDGVTILLAEVAGQLAGFTMLVSRSSHPLITASSPIELRKFYVDPAHHGSGIAHALMQATIPLFDDPQHDAVWLSVYSGNARAISFYKRWGFGVIGTHYFHVGGDPQKDFVMQRHCARGTE
jgi:diamine N-acetyltransferase